LSVWVREEIQALLREIKLISFFYLNMLKCTLLYIYYIRGDYMQTIAFTEFRKHAAGFIGSEQVVAEKVKLDILNV
jgi:hypothetical protein